MHLLQFTAKIVEKYSVHLLDGFILFYKSLTRRRTDRRLYSSSSELYFDRLEASMSNLWLPLTVSSLINLYIAVYGNEATLSWCK